MTEVALIPAMEVLGSANAQVEIARDGLGTPILERMVGLVGMAVMLGIAWLLSSSRGKVNWRLVGMGLVVQVAFAFLVLKTPVGRGLFQGANAVFLKLLEFTKEGAAFIFGGLVDDMVPVGTLSGEPPELTPVSSPELWVNTGASIAFFVLPTIIVFSSLM